MKPSTGVGIDDPLKGSRGESIGETENVRERTGLGLRGWKEESETEGVPEKTLRLVSGGKSDSLGNLS